MFKPQTSRWIAIGLILTVPALALLTFSPIGAAVEPDYGTLPVTPASSTNGSSTAPGSTISDLSNWKYSGNSKKSKKSKKSPKSKKSKKKK